MEGTGGEDTRISIKKKSKSSSKTTSGDLTKALEQIASSVSISALTSWNLQNALSNCSSELLREYNNTIIKQQIQLLRQSAPDVTRAHPNITPMQLSNTYTDETTTELSLGDKENEVICNNTNGNRYESEL